jgi:hypothetical protein
MVIDTLCAIVEAENSFWIGVNVNTHTAGIDTRIGIGNSHFYGFTAVAREIVIHQGIRKIRSGREYPRYTGKSGGIEIVCSERPRTVQARVQTGIENLR